MIEKTIARIGYAMITAATASAITYGNLTWLESEKAGGREISSEPQGELQEEHADGKVVMSYDNNGGYKHNLTLLAALDSVDNACYLFAREHDEPTAHGRLRIQLQMMFSTPSSLLRAPRRAWRWQSRSDDGCLRAGRPSRSRDRSRTARDARDAVPSSR